MCSPTWLIVCEKQPISITSLQMIDTVLIATEFTEAQLCIAARSKCECIPNSVDRTIMIC